jgi:hypothetical protein
VDDFRAYGWAGPSRRVDKHGTQNKGHREQLRAFVNELRTRGLAAGNFPAAVWTTQAALAAQESLRQGVPMHVQLDL